MEIVQLYKHAQVMLNVVVEMLVAKHKMAVIYAQVIKHNF